MSIIFQDKTIRTLTDLDVSGKKVLCRVDFNVPVDQGEVRDDNRIVAALPTLRYCLERGATLVLCSHMGRPKGKVMKEFSLLPVAERLATLLDRDVILPDDCVGLGVRRVLDQQNADTVVLLENLRFHAGEKDNDPNFAQQLTSGCEVFINDAFGAVHRAHASTSAVAKYFSEKGVGLLVEKELEFLGQLLTAPDKPYAVILGGAKISDKVKVVEHLLKKVDMVLLGGAMVFTFLKAEGRAVGKSLVEDDMVPVAKKILGLARQKNVRILFPKDFVVAPSINGGQESQVVEHIPADMMGLDIGPKTIEYYGDALSQTQTVFWNGPMGLFEKAPFDRGTVGIAKILGKLTGTRIIGGGDSAAAVKQAGLANQMSHISTGGGASLEFLEGKSLPGLQALAV